MQIDCTQMQYFCTGFEKQAFFGILILRNFERSSHDGLSDVFVGHKNQCLGCFALLSRQAALDKCNLTDRNLIIEIIELILIERIIGIERKGIGISMPEIFLDDDGKH